MCWKMGKEYFWDLREECPIGLNEILTICNHYLIHVWSTSEIYRYMMKTGCCTV